MSGRPGALKRFLGFWGKPKEAQKLGKNKGSGLLPRPLPEHATFTRLEAPDKQKIMKIFTEAEGMEYAKNTITAPEFADVFEKLAELFPEKRKAVFAHLTNFLEMEKSQGKGKVTNYQGIKLDPRSPNRIMTLLIELTERIGKR